MYSVEPKFACNITNGSSSKTFLLRIVKVISDLEHLDQENNSSNIHLTIGSQNKCTYIIHNAF